MSVKLFKHQTEALELTKDKNRVAYYYDMGLGKTYIGSEKAVSLGNYTLVVCQKSKVKDWIDHFETHYGKQLAVDDLTKNKVELNGFINGYQTRGLCPRVGIINYDLVWRRPELTSLSNYTLLLDESSLIQNPASKRSKFILKKLNPSNVILLSGTPVNGKYEQIWSQCHLLGWEISKKMFYAQYVIEEPIRKWNGEAMTSPNGFVIKQIVGYKNVDRLKRKLREYGAVFMKTEEVFDLPSQTFIDVNVPVTKEYNKFMKDKIITINDETLIGDMSLTKRLYRRMLCGHLNKNKLDAFEDLVESTNDRLIVFYNFTKELYALEDIAIKLDRPVSIVNGSEKDLKCYEEYDNSITLIQYQAGAMGLNLQKANKIIYFTPTDRCELFEQSKKRIHRIGTTKPCFYYLLKSGVDDEIYEALNQGKDYTDYLFK